MNSRTSSTQCLRALVSLLALALLSIIAVGQQPTRTPAQELQRRLELVAMARQADDPASLTEASKGVAALGLRQFATLRLSEGMSAVAAELASESLMLEESSDTRFMMASALFRAGHYDEAYTELTAITTREPKSAAAWDLLGRVALAKKDYRAAADALTKSAAMRPDLETSYTLGVALLSAKDVDGATAVFKKLIETGGDAARMHIMAGRAYENAKVLDKAEAEYRAAIAANAKTSRGHYFLGLLLLTKNAWEVTPEARKEFEAEIALNPDDFFGNYFMGCILSGEKNYVQSDRYLKVAAAAKPDWPEPFLYLGLNAYGEQNNVAAEDYLRKAIKLTGADVSRNNSQIRKAFYTLGRILIQGGTKKDEGLALVQRSKEMEAKLLKDSRDQMLELRDASAGAPGAQEQVTVAEPKVSPLTASSPLSTDAWIAVKMDPDEKLRAQAVEQQLRQILGTAFNDLGTTSARMREFPLAMSYFHDAERWDTSTPGLMRNLGMAAFLSSNYAEAVRAMKAAEQQHPLDPSAQSMLALALYSTNKYDAAVKAFAPVGDGVWDDPRMAYALAVSLAKSHDSKRASDVLGRLRTMGLPANVQVMIGEVYDEIGDHASAQACFESAKKLDPSVKLPK